MQIENQAAPWGEGTGLNLAKLRAFASLAQQRSEQGKAKRLQAGVERHETDQETERCGVNSG